MSIRDKLWGTGKKATQEEVVELTNQFYVTLRAYFAQIKKEGEASARNKEAFNRVKALLEPPPGEEVVQNWTNAYEIEQLLVHLFDDDTVATELAVRILEGRSILRPELAAMYDAHFNDIENPSPGEPAVDPQTLAVRRRRLLARLINDLQWRYIVNEATRRYSKLITRRTATLSVTALTFFVGAIVLIATRQFTYGDLHLLWVAGLAGTWGATFSMLATVKSRLGESNFDDLKLMKAGSVLLSRAAIGAGAACILFFFLLSGLLAGSAFPSLTGPRDDGRQNTAAPAPATTPAAPGAAPSADSSSTGLDVAVSTAVLTTAPSPGAKPQQETAAKAGTSLGSPYENYLLPAEIALLIVWCFIAGFSEQLIPGLLATTEARAGAATPPATDRFRPTLGTTVAPPPARQPNPPPNPPAPPASGTESSGETKPEQEQKE